MAMPRGELERDLRDVAELFGWRDHHERVAALLRDGRPDGFPEDVFVRDGLLVMAARLGADREPTREQTRWLELLGSVTRVEALAFVADDLTPITDALRDLRGRQQ